MVRKDASSAWHKSGVALVADDEPGIRNMAAAVLESAGLTVITAHDGLDAVRKFEANQTAIDVVVLDLTMPGMDGIEVLQHIMRLTSTVKVVLSSGYNEQEIDKKLPRGRVASFLRKPYLPADLINSVRAAMDTPAASAGASE